MRSRPAHLLLSLTTLVVAALVWLAPKAAFAGDATFSASFAASFAPALPAPSVTDRLARIAPTDRAPLCDPRGATTFAPPPQMQDVEVSLDSGLTLEECLSSLRDNDVKRGAPVRAPVPLDASSASSTPRSSVPASCSPPARASSCPLRPRAPRAHVPVFAAQSTDRRAPEGSSQELPIPSDQANRARVRLSSRGVRKAASSSSRTT